MEENGILKTRYLGWLDRYADEIAAVTVSSWRQIPGMTPNILTFFGGIFGALALVALYKKSLWFIPLFIVNRYFDWIDGQFARRYKMVTKEGDRFDHLSDILLTTGGFLILVARYKLDWREVIGCLILALVWAGGQACIAKETSLDLFLARHVGHLCNDLTKKTAPILDTATCISYSDTSSLLQNSQRAKLIANFRPTSKGWKGYNHLY